MCHWTVGLIKSNTLNMITPIFTLDCNKCLCIITVVFLNTWSNELMEDLCYVRKGFIGMVSKIRLICLFLLYLTYKSCFLALCMSTLYSFTNILWCAKFLWDTNFNILNHRSNLIKYGTNIFNISPMVAIPS